MTNAKKGSELTSQCDVKSRCSHVTA